VARAKSESSRGVEVRYRRGNYRSLLWDEIEDEISPQLFVTLKFIVRLATATMRDEMESRVSVIKEEYANYGMAGGKDEIGDLGASP
jgi:hypothetical protein